MIMSFPFDERDNTNLNTSGRLTAHLTRQFDAYGEVGAGATKAAGKDSTSNAVNDIGYHETDLTFGMRWGIGRREQVVLSSAISYAHQKFTSIKFADLSHFHRVDKEYDYDIELSWRAYRHWQPGISYSYRKSNSSADSAFADVGSFNGYRLGLQLSFIM